MLNLHLKKFTFEKSFGKISLNQEICDKQDMFAFLSKDFDFKYLKIFLVKYLGKSMPENTFLDSKIEFGIKKDLIWS